MAMSKHRARKPWVVEMQPPNSKGWYAIQSCYDEDEAKMQVELVQKRQQAAAEHLHAKLRYRDLRVGS